MQTTCVFKNGHSQAVRIPAEISYSRTDIEFETERIEDELRIRPACRSLSGVLNKFSLFSGDFVSKSLRHKNNKKEIRCNGDLHAGYKYGHLSD